MSGTITKNAGLVSLMIAGLLFAGCGSQPEVSPEQDDVPNQTAAEEQTELDDSEPQISRDVLAEREQFVEDQQLPLDGSPLVAVTPEQQQFIGEQRAHVESQGGTWSAQAESITLALTADACESAILNGHSGQTQVVEMHIATSPIFASAIPEDITGQQRTQAEASMADIMVYGMQHMCPADFSAWGDAVIELYPEYFGPQQ